MKALYYLIAFFPLVKGKFWFIVNSNAATK